MTSGGTRYRFGPRERSGVLAGWRAGQVLTIALGLLVGVLVVRLHPNALGVGTAMAVLLVCVVLATWPVNGRTGEEWFPVVVRWGSLTVRPGGTRRLDSLCGLRLLDAGRSDMGVVHDCRRRTLTAALSLRGQSFALLGPDEQNRRVAAWSAVLASVAREGSPVRRLQWLASSFPDAGRGVRSYLSRGTRADPASACVASYEALLADMDADACTHEVVLAVQVRQQKSVEDGCEVLWREVSTLVRQLADADVEVEGVLSADDLASHLLRTYEPDASPGQPPTPVADPWPMAMEERWGSVQVDGLAHATYWVAEWPHTEVRSDFLAPLLLGSARATLSVVMEPFGPEKAVRRIEASRTADLADAELRRRSGFVSTARHARASEVLAHREAELADGHAAYRYAGFITVSAPTEAELATACDTVLHAAGQCRLVLRRLYGDQSSAYTCTLPLARGLS
ncbi:MAG TPA: SCO6880 family protein [Acidimicrobiales bacterium]|nr:SCO6880 family protein [Acidimicrobiales bacterium]